MKEEHVMGIVDLTLFFGYPSDVEEEITRATEMARDISDLWGSELGFSITTKEYRRNTYPNVSFDIQKALFSQIGEYDIFTAVFWKKHGAGTVAEFRDSMKRRKESIKRREDPPIIMLYFKEPDLLDPDQIDPAIKTFRKSLDLDSLPDGQARYSTFRTTADFQLDFNRHLSLAVKVKRKKISSRSRREPCSSADSESFVKSLQRLIELMQIINDESSAAGRFFGGITEAPITW